MSFVRFRSDFKNARKNTSQIRQKSAVHINGTMALCLCFVKWLPVGSGRFPGEACGEHLRQSVVPDQPAVQVVIQAEGAVMEGMVIQADSPG